MTSTNYTSAFAWAQAQTGKTYLQFWWVITTIASSALNHEHIIIFACWLKLFKTNLPTHGVDGAVAQLWTERVLTPTSFTQQTATHRRQRPTNRPVKVRPSLSKKRHRRGSDATQQQVVHLHKIAALPVPGGHRVWLSRATAAILQVLQPLRVVHWQKAPRPHVLVLSVFTDGRVNERRRGKPLAPAGSGTGVGKVWAGSGGFVITGPVSERRSITANNTSGERKKVEMYMFVRSEAIHDYLFTWIIRLSQTRSQQFQFIRPAQGDLTVWLMGLTELMSFLRERHGVADMAIGSCTSCCQFLGKSWLEAGGPRGLIRVWTGWPPARARGQGPFGGQFKPGRRSVAIYSEDLVPWISCFTPALPPL